MYGGARVSRKANRIPLHTHDQKVRKKGFADHLNYCVAALVPQHRLYYKIRVELQGLFQGFCRGLKRKKFLVEFAGDAFGCRLEVVRINLARYKAVSGAAAGDGDASAA